MAATWIKSILQSSVRRCKVDKGTLKIAPRHIYQDIAVKSCRTCCFGVGRINSVCCMLESKKVCTEWVRCFRHRPLPYASLARVLTFPIALEHVAFPERATVLVNMKPRMVISGLCNMSIMFIDVSHEPSAMAFVFRMFKGAPVALS